MPEAEYVWLPKADILTFDETARLVSRFCDAGVDRLRITGGEPLLRQDLPGLVAQLTRETRLREISLTTNGVLLPRHGQALMAAGVGRVTISIDSLDRDRFARLAGCDALAETLAGIDSAIDLGWPVKLNVVVIRGENDDELIELVEFGRRRGVEVRFIEYMDVGGATAWADRKVVSRQQILTRLREQYGDVQPVISTDWAPAARYRLPAGDIVGIISSTTEPFCRTCDRSRITADGMWYTCLYARSGVDLRRAMRAGATDGELAELIGRVWANREDRGAEQRAALRARSPLAAQDELRADPHLEMHTRGG